jgi:hypothetical protein
MDSAPPGAHSNPGQWCVILLPLGLWHGAKRRPIDAKDPATIVLLIEPIHDRVDQHPFEPVVLE